MRQASGGRAKTLAIWVLDGDDAVPAAERLTRAAQR